MKRSLLAVLAGLILGACDPGARIAPSAGQREGVDWRIDYDSLGILAPSLGGISGTAYFAASFDFENRRQSTILVDQLILRTQEGAYLAAIGPESEPWGEARTRADTIPPGTSHRIRAHWDFGGIHLATILKCPCEVSFRVRTAAQQTELRLPYRRLSE